MIYLILMMMVLVAGVAMMDFDDAVSRFHCAKTSRFSHSSSPSFLAPSYIFPYKTNSNDL